MTTTAQRTAKLALFTVGALGLASVASSRRRKKTGGVIKLGTASVASAELLPPMSMQHIVPPADVDQDPTVDPCTYVPDPRCPPPKSPSDHTRPPETEMPYGGYWASLENWLPLRMMRKAKGLRLHNSEGMFNAANPKDFRVRMEAADWTSIFAWTAYTPHGAEYDTRGKLWLLGDILSLGVTAMDRAIRGRWINLSWHTSAKHDFPVIGSGQRNYLRLVEAERKRRVASIAYAPQNHAIGFVKRGGGFDFSAPAVWVPPLGLYSPGGPLGPTTKPNEP